MEEKNKVSWATIFAVVSVWFGAHAGGGFASGNQSRNFFTQFGWPAIFTPVLAMFILALVYRIILIMCNQHGCNNYNDWSHKLYAPYDRVISPVYEVCNLGAGMLATSASIAGASAIVQSTFNIPYMPAVIIMSILTIVVSMYGASVISKVSTVLVILIVIATTSIGLLAIANQGGTILNDIQTGYAPQGVGPAIWKSITYASFQIFSLIGTFGVALNLKNEEACNKAAIMGFFVNASMLLLNALTVWAFREQIANAEIPILEISKLLKVPVLSTLYTVSLFSAFLSTAAAVVFGTKKIKDFNVKAKKSE